MAMMDGWVKIMFELIYLQCLFVGGGELNLEWKKWMHDFTQQLFLSANNQSLYLQFCLPANKK